MLGQIDLFSAEPYQLAGQLPDVLPKLNGTELRPEHVGQLPAFSEKL